MENVVLTIHLILSLLLVGVVLLQRSEGGGLGMGGGGGGVMTGRGAASALTRLTWILTVAFICTSIALTILAAADSAGSSVTDQFGGRAPAEEVPLTAPLSDSLLPPPASDAPADAPLPEN
jgi:preprotein translocase subunit SecG